MCGQISRRSAHGPRRSRDEKKLEMWGRAQREAAVCRKFDWGTAKVLQVRLQQSQVAQTQLRYHIHV